MTEHERIESIAEARRFYMAAPIIVPMLEKRKDITLQRLMAKYRDGATDYANVVAELYTIDNLLREIKTQEQIYRVTEEKNANRRS